MCVCERERERAALTGFEVSRLGCRGWRFMASEVEG